MAMRHDLNTMDHNFLPADPPPIPDMDYQSKGDLASEYFNTFSQICGDGYRPDSEVPSLRQTSDSLRVSSEIIGIVRPETEYVNTDFLGSEAFLSRKEEPIFQFGQPDTSALLRHRARRKYNEEHGLQQPPPATSQESGVSYCWTCPPTP